MKKENCQHTEIRQAMIDNYLKQRGEEKRLRPVMENLNGLCFPKPITGCTVSSPPPAKTSSLATVHYMQSLYDGLIGVVDLENFYTLSEISKKFGATVTVRYYANDNPDAKVMYVNFDGPDGPYKHIVKKRTGEVVLKVGEWYTPEDFIERINYMRECGARLGRIRRDEKVQKERAKTELPRVSFAKIVI